MADISKINISNTDYNIKDATARSSAIQMATQKQSGRMSAADKQKLDNIAANANNYTLPNATDEVLGGVKVHKTPLTQVAGTPTSVSSRSYYIQKLSNGLLGVNVPWVNTTYNNATTSAAGLMSAADKTKLNSALTTSGGTITGDLEVTGGLSVGGEIITNSNIHSYGQISTESGVTIGYNSTPCIDFCGESQIKRTESIDGNELSIITDFVNFDKSELLGDGWSIFQNNDKPLLFIDGRVDASDVWCSSIKCGTIDLSSGQIETTGPTELSITADDLWFDNSALSGSSWSILPLCPSAGYNESRLNIEKVETIDIDCNNNITAYGKVIANKGFALLNPTNKILLANGTTLAQSTFASASHTHASITTSAGSYNTPVYFSGGKPVAVALNNTANNLINNLSEGTSTPTDADYYISQYVGGGTTQTTYHRRPHSALYSYIKDKANGTWDISVSGNAGSLSSRGRLTAYEEGSATMGESGINLYEVYNNGYPVTFGNLIHMHGGGAGQLLAEWTATEGATGHLYYRSKRDNNENGWTSWGKVAFVTDNVASSSKWATARTLTIGNTGKSVNGSANVSWSLSEIGAAAANHSHAYVKEIDFRGLPFTITKGDGSTYSQKAGYLYKNTGAIDWVHLGTFNTDIQGDGGEIWLFGGAGQNGEPFQNMWAHLFIKQGYQSTASTTERYAATYEVFCTDNKSNYWYENRKITFKVFCKEIGKVDVWAYFGNNYSRCYYYPAGRYDSFVPSNELLSSEPTDESIYGVEQPISGGFVIPSKNGYSVDDMLPLTGGTINGDLTIQGTGNLAVQGDLNVLGDVTFSEGILYTDEIKGFSENHKTLILGTRDNSGYIYLTDDIRGAEWSVISGKFICANVTANGFIHSNPVNNANDILLANGSTLAQSTFSSSGHTHDDRYYTESEIDTKLNAKSNTDHTHNYLPLSGGFMTGNIWYTGLGTSYIGLGRNDGANEVGGALNNLVISSWYGVSFTTSCGGQKYSGTNAVSIDCRNGIVYAEKFIGSLQGNAATATKASSADSVSWSNVTGKPVAYQPVSHNHDDRYYTESEIDTKLNAKSNTDHTHAYLSLTGGKVTGDLGVSGELLTKRIESPTDNSILLGSGTNAGYIAMSDDLVGNSTPTNAGSNWCIEFGGDAFFSSVSQTSDQRLKENIHDVDKSFTEKYWETDNGLIHEYDWKKSGKHANGMIAQELLNYIPEAVNHNVEDDSYSVDYTSAMCKMMGAMFQKIKQLESEIEKLKNK